MASKQLSKILIPFLSNPVARVVVFVVLVALAGVSVSVLSNIEYGIETAGVVPDDSYAVVYGDTALRYWPGKRVMGMNTILMDVDYSDPYELETCCYNYSLVSTEKSMYNWFEQQDGMIGKMGATGPTWLQVHLQALKDLDLDPTDRDTFYGYLQPVLGSTHYSRQLVCPDEKTLANGGDCSTGIKAAETTTFFETFDDTMKIHEVNLLLNSDRKNLDPHLANKGTGFAWHQFFCYGEMDSSIALATTETMALALVAVLICVTMALDATSAVVSGIIVALIDVDLVAIMTFLDIKLAGPSFVCLVMSVGLSVDYCVHICHGYMHSGGTTPKERMVGGVRMMAGAVFKGAFTTFLGVLVLSQASSSVFRTFFYLLFSTVVLGTIHGLLLAPVLLIWLDQAKDVLLKPSSTVAPS